VAFRPLAFGRSSAGTPLTMGEKRRTNSELNLDRLAQEEALREEERGILELFDHDAQEPDEDAPIERDRSE
jgi:hypothetical protein